MAHEILKIWLNRYREAYSDLENLWSRIDAARSRLESARTSILDGMPHDHGGSSDRIGAALAQIEELQAEAGKLREKAESLRHKTEAAIRKINGPRWPDRRCVLLCRYVDGESWPVVAEILFGSRPDFEDRQESYLRRVHKLHGEALSELEQIVVTDFELHEITIREEYKK